MVQAEVVVITQTWMVVLVIRLAHLLFKVTAVEPDKPALTSAVVAEEEQVLSVLPQLDQE